MSYPPGSIIEQIYVVRDLDAAIASWSKMLAAGPFFEGRADIPAERCQRLATQAPLSMRVAYGVSAGILIELVQPLPGDGSIYSDELAMMDDMQHSRLVGFLVNLGWEEGSALMSSKYPEAMRVVTNVGGLRCSFYDARKDVGFYLEIGEGAQQMLPEMIAGINRRKSGWDGKKIYALEDIMAQNVEG